MKKLFVYGTLAPNKPNEHILKEISGTWKKATAKGNLHEKGWGAKMGCNGIVLDKNGGDIDGLVYSSNELDKLWEKLDNLEGEEYRRVLTDVVLEDGNVEKVYIYELNIG